MLIRTYKDKDGYVYDLNLEHISAVGTSANMPFESLHDDDIVTVWFGGFAFPTFKRVYLEMLDDLNKKDSSCDLKPVMDDTEGHGSCESTTPSISMYHAKRKIMGADYISADTKMRLLADLDIVL